MREVKPLEVAEDGPGKGMPRENLEALKTFLAERRQGEPQQKQISSARALKELPSVFDTLPETMRLRLGRFFVELKQTKFLRPTQAPDPSWVMHYGETWLKAREEVMDKTTSHNDSSFDTGDDWDWEPDNNAETRCWDVLKRMGRTEQLSAALRIMDQIISTSMGEQHARIAEDAQNDLKLMVNLLLIAEMDLFVANAEWYGKYKSIAELEWGVWRSGYALRGYGRPIGLGQVEPNKLYAYAAGPVPETHGELI